MNSSTRALLLGVRSLAKRPSTYAMPLRCRRTFRFARFSQVRSAPPRTFPVRFVNSQLTDNNDLNSPPGTARANYQLVLTNAVRAQAA